jgi:hypothetical protein
MTQVDEWKLEKIEFEFSDYNQVVPAMVAYTFDYELSRKVVSPD